MERKITIRSRQFSLPAWAPARIALGIVLILGGFAGFLPVVGFWMIPLGIGVLSYDIPRVRLARQRLTAWWRNRKSV